MPVFPPGVPVVVLVDGRRISAYNQAYANAGRIFAPVRPYVTALADRTWYDGDRLAITRDGHTVYVTLRATAADVPNGAYVPLAAVARELGARVEYRRGELDIFTAPRAVIPAPTAVPPGALVAPRVVFTPMPVPTPRATWNGLALPRRTPLPYRSPQPVSTAGNRPQVLRAESTRARGG